MGWIWAGTGVDQKWIWSESQMDHQIPSHCPQCGCHCRGFSTVRISVAEMESYHRFLEACQGPESDQRRRRFFISVSREAQDACLQLNWWCNFLKNKKNKIVLWEFCWRWPLGRCILGPYGDHIPRCWLLWRLWGHECLFQNIYFFLFLTRFPPKIIHLFSICCLISPRD